MDTELKEYLKRIESKIDTLNIKVDDIKETVENSEMMLKALYYDNRDEIRKLKAVK